MFTVLKAIKGKCPLCMNKKELPLFVVKSESYTGRCCAEHLHGLASEEADQEEKAVPANGQPVQQ